MATSEGSPAVVLLVDDHPLVRHGLRSLLEAERWVARVVEAANAGDAARLATTGPPDVAVVDLGLPDSDGTELIRVLRRIVPRCPVLVLTMTRDDASVRACLDAGAAGYLLKDTPPMAVVNAIRTALDGGTVLGPRVTAGPARGAGGTGAAGGARLPPPLDRLTPYDVKVLTLLAEGQRNSEIARALGVTEKTVRNRLSGILARLGVADRLQAALLAREKGLLGPPQS